jgi:hypothetical protein
MFIHDPQFPQRCGDLLPNAAGAPPEAAEYKDKAPDEKLLHARPSSTSRLLKEHKGMRNGVSHLTLSLHSGFEDADQDVVSRLQEDFDAPLRETLLEGIAFFSRPLGRRPHKDIRVFIFIDRPCDLNGGFWTELFHK